MNSQDNLEHGWIENDWLLSEEEIVYDEDFAYESRRDMELEDY